PYLLTLSLTDALPISKPSPPPAREVSARDCVDLDHRVMKYLDGYHRVRRIYAQTGDASESKSRLGPLATKAEIAACGNPERQVEDRKSTRLNSSHVAN